MDEDRLTQHVDQIVEARPHVPIEAPRDQHRCVIEEVWDEGHAYLGLRVSVDADFRRQYTTPGQYVTLSPDHLGPRFLVIANAPERARANGWEFLIDRQTELGASIDPLEAGATLTMSPPEGPGFPTELATDRQLLCFVTGSGIASIRPAIQYWHDHPDRSPSSITIYYGETDPDDFAYPDELYEWTQRSIRVFRCWESLENQSEGFRYVQHAFDVDNPDLDDPAVFIAGAPPMKRIVAERLLRMGVDFDRIATNVGTEPAQTDNSPA